MRMKKFIALITVGTLFSFPVAAQTFSGGTGSEESPYLLTKAADLEELATLVTGGNDFSGKYLRLDADITLSGATMVGHTGALQPKKFAGTFDGNNHVISGFKVNLTKKHVALFSAVAPAGVVKNITLSSPEVSSGDSYGGCLIAANEGLIENCHVTNGTFETTSGSYKGGVVGDNKGTVKGCSFSGTITAATNAGGIVGQNWSMVQNCHSSATIVSTIPNQTSVQFGGITGISIKLNTVPHIYDCYFTGSIQCQSGNNCGGITGTLSGCDMLRCWNSGFIDGKGVVGSLTGNFEKGSSIKDCYNTGTVYNMWSVDKIGGLVGFVSNDKSALSIENCINVGPIFVSVLARQDNIEFAGGTVSGATINGCWFDSQISGIHTVANGKTTAELTSGTPLDNFDTSVWTFAKGMYPRLANSANTDEAMLAATPIFLAAQDKATRVTSNFTVGTANDVEWEMRATSAASLRGNNVVVTRGQTKASVMLTAYLGNCEKRMLVYVYPQIFSGDGSAESPYIIATADDVMKLSVATNEQEMDFTGEYFKMTGDIDMAGRAFEPFAFRSAALAFNGVFDGGGYSIKNLSMDSRTNKVLNAGLFRTIASQGSVKNLNIDKSCQFVIYRNFGSFATNLHGTLENCRNFADIPTSDGYTGGLVYIAEDGSRIINCYNEGNVSATANAGSMAGIAYNNYGTISGCQNNGNITGGSGTSSTLSGIVCTNYGTITNVLNTGCVTANTNVAGIVTDNRNTGKVSNAVSIGQIAVRGARTGSGAAIGKDAGGIFENVSFDAQVSISGDSFDGVSGLKTAQLIGGNLSLADSDWTKIAGEYPVLTIFKDLAASKLASKPVLFTNGASFNQLKGEGTLAQAEGLVWTLKDGKSFAINGNKLVVTSSDASVKDELTASFSGYNRTLALASMAVIFEGEGTLENPYLVKTASDIKKLAEDVVSANNDYAGKNLLLTQDINMAGETIAPIAGNGLIEFKGAIDGNGHSVDNFIINETTIDGVGFVGRLGDVGSIKNLTIGENAKINGKSSVGGLVGILAGSVKHCVNNAVLSTTATTSNLGGIAGQTIGDALIEDCVNNADIVGKSTVGGIVGNSNGSGVVLQKVVNNGAVIGTTKIAGIAGNMAYTTINQAVNNASVVGTTDVAGIAGYTNKECAITAAHNLGYIEGATEVGGVIGYAYVDLTVDGCFNAGEISASASTAAGLIARGAQPTIKNSFNVGAVVNTKTGLTSTTPGAGGLVGKGDPIITDCYNAGSVTAEKNVGGLVASYNASYKAMSFNKVYQAGRVICTAAVPTNVGVYIGLASTSTTAKPQITETYYDKQLLHDMNPVDGAVSTSELIAKDFGQAWNMHADALPTLKGFEDNDHAKLHSSTIIANENENHAAVTNAVILSKAHGVEWSADPAAFTINDGKAIPMPQVAGEYALTAKLGKISRNIVLKLTGLATSINDIDANGQIRVAEGSVVFLKDCASYSVFAADGTLVAQGKAAAGDSTSLTKGIYVIIVNSTALKIQVK